MKETKGCALVIDACIPFVQAHIRTNVQVSSDPNKSPTSRQQSVFNTTCRLRRRIGAIPHPMDKGITDQNAQSKSSDGRLKLSPGGGVGLSPPPPLLLGPGF